MRPLEGSGVLVGGHGDGGPGPRLCRHKQEVSQPLVTVQFSGTSKRIIVLDYYRIIFAFALHFVFLDIFYSIDVAIVINTALNFLCLILNNNPSTLSHL